MNKGLRKEWNKEYVEIHNLSVEPHETRDKIADWWLSKIEKIEHKHQEEKKDLIECVKAGDDAYNLLISKYKKKMFNRT